uniref:Ovule protein n=1 Tax=Parascaris univalens TaxID=6257 RepID=A0A915AJF4_PARUN
MSLDKTLENVNSSLEQLTVDVSQLLDVVKVAISILFAALVFMIVGLTILCCYVKCKKVHLSMCFLNEFLTLTILFELFLLDIFFMMKVQL